MKPLSHHISASPLPVASPPVHPIDVRPLHSVTSPSDAVPRRRLFRRRKHPPMTQNKQPWKSGTVVDCFDDVDVSLHGGANNPNDEGIDPCLIYCLIMSLSACTLQCLYAYSTRTDIRRKYNLEEEPCDDCMTHICCHCCALCQEHRELRQYPITSWPMPAASQDMPLPPPQPGFIPNAGPPQPPSVQYMGHAPQNVYQRYTQSTASSSGSQIPLQYANYPHSHHHPQGYPGSPYVVQQAGYYPMNQFPATPPRPGPPQPLVYETHRMSGPYGGGILPGIPAHVYHVPKFPDMRPGGAAPLAPSRSDDGSSRPR